MQRPMLLLVVRGIRFANDPFDKGSRERFVPRTAGKRLVFGRIENGLSHRLRVHIAPQTSSCSGTPSLALSRASRRQCELSTAIYTKITAASRARSASVQRR